MLGVILGGCGVEAPHGQAPPLGQGGGGGEGGAPSHGGVTCSDGDTRDCHVVIGSHGNVLSCFDGVQICEDGAWSSCGDGDISYHTMPEGDAPAAQGSDEDPSTAPGAAQDVDHADHEGLDEAPGSTPLSLSDAGPCKNNPCDPSCRNFNETPLNGGIVTATGWTAGGWVGLKNRAPPGLLKKGMSPPCSTASECQFGFYCDNPVSGTCSHHKCAPGEALKLGCDPCVDEVCAKNPSCCAAPAKVGTCAHSLCVSGAKLTAGCDAPSSCVSKVCAKDPTCCSGAWSQKCVDLVQPTCGQTCGGWTEACVDAVHDVCGAFCSDPPAETCAHAPCYAGKALDPAVCGKCAADVCALKPSCCTSAWDDACVNLVPGVCGAACPPQGACKQWVAGEKDEKCDGVDLVQGIPCQDGFGKNQVVVCNVGTKPAPAGVEVVVYNGNSGHMPSCDPGGNGKSCGKTTQKIPAGSCVNLDCTSQLNGNEEVYVNPSGPNHVDECTCKNNWSMFVKPGTALKCEAPLCSGSQTSILVKKPNLYFTVDRSAALPTADFARLKLGLKAFFQDKANFLDPVPKYPGYAVPPGVGVELEFFPDVVAGKACSASACDATQCAPRVARGNAFATAPPADTQEQALVNAVNGIAQDAGGAPTSAALAAALARASSYYIAANNLADVSASPTLPGEDASIVLLLASEPPSCNTTTVGLAGLAATNFATYGIKTHVIGLGISKQTVDAIAAAGGGMGFVLPLGPGLDTAVAATLKKLRTRLFSCSYPLPEASLFDATTPVFTYGPGGNSAQSIQFHTDPSQCNPSPGNSPWLMGFHYAYDDDGKPTSIELCDATCTNINNDIGSGVRVRLQCAGSSTSELYQGVCPPGSKAQWGFMAYDTTTPFNTKVAFKVRLAETPAELANEPFVTLATAQGAVWPPTNKCAMSGPKPCPIDLVNAFGGVNSAQGEWLELSMTLTPDAANTATPTVNNWQITYSCPPTD